MEIRVQIKRLAVDVLAQILTSTGKPQSKEPGESLLIVATYQVEKMIGKKL